MAPTVLTWGLHPPACAWALGLHWSLDLGFQSQPILELKYWSPAPAMSVPGYGPCWSRPLSLHCLPGSILNLPCHCGLTQQSLVCFWPSLLSRDLILTHLLGLTLTLDTPHHPGCRLWSATSCLPHLPCSLLGTAGQALSLQTGLLLLACSFSPVTKELILAAPRCFLF